MQDMTDFMREFLDYYFTQVHTSFPGVVTEYDPATRRATVQPSLKRRAGNKEYIDFPLLIDVPVLYPGTKKYTIHFPLEKDDEVAVFFSERALEEWKNVGQDGIEDPDPRRYDLCDAYCVPGLQPQEFIAAEEPGLQIIHKDGFDGKLISQVLMTDDKIETIYKEKAKVLIEDDHISGTTEKCKVDLTADVAVLANSKSTFTLNADKFSMKNGSNGFVEFTLNERGKIRHIKSIHISERVVQKCLCDEVLTSLRDSLAEAQSNVDIAVDRMQDAENYALWIDAQNIQLKEEAARLKKSAPIGFAFGGVGFGVGVPLTVEGIRSDNRTMMWSGVGTAAGTGLIWAAGHYLFRWW